jgi:hypothetical protein
MTPHQISRNGSVPVPSSAAGAASVPNRFGLIIGAMKCGTTSLFSYLATHPEVAPCRTKEPNFFSSEAFDPNDRASYFALWDWKPNVYKVAIEASVNYTKIPSKPNCADRIAQWSDLDFRFIYCMRNPIDRIESHVYHGLYAGWTRPVDEGISEHTLNVSRYAMQLDAYAKRFGRERILLVVLEEFEKAPTEHYRRICEFLGVDATVGLPNLGAHNRASDHYLENSIWDRARSVSWIRQFASYLPVAARRAVLRSTGRRMKARRQLTSLERASVALSLRSDLLRLESEYSIDYTSAWGIEV